MNYDKLKEMFKTPELFSRKSLAECLGMDEFDIGLTQDSFLKEIENFEKEDEFKIEDYMEKE